VASPAVPVTCVHGPRRSCDPAVSEQSHRTASKLTIVGEVCLTNDGQGSSSVLRLSLCSLGGLQARSHTRSCRLGAIGHGRQGEAGRDCGRGDRRQPTRTWPCRLGVGHGRSGEPSAGLQLQARTTTTTDSGRAVGGHWGRASQPGGRFTCQHHHSYPRADPREHDPVAACRSWWPSRPCSSG